MDCVQSHQQLIERQFARAERLTQPKSPRPQAAVNSPEILNDKALHDLRVTCKKLRGLLRLYRLEKSPLKKRMKTIERELAAIARMLSSQRDAQVLNDLLEKLIVRATEIQALQIREIQQTLQNEKNQHPSVETAMLHVALSNLKNKWQQSIKPGTPLALEKALRKSIKSSHKKGRKALDSKHPVALHEWRKQVKYQMYQMDVLPDSYKIEKRRKLLKKTGSLLGDIHDLDVLLQYVKDYGKDGELLKPLLKKRRTRKIKRVAALFDALKLTAQQERLLLAAL